MYDLFCTTLAEIKPCASSPCYNGGTCVSEDPFSFGCLCSPGFNGSFCEVECLCENGGLCVSEEPLSFGCVCLEGYTGASCELDIDECLEAVCEDGMICINEIPGFMCVVPISAEDGKYLYQIKLPVPSSSTKIVPVY